MTKLDALFDDYSSHHQTSGNKAMHRLGIPLIMLSLFGMLARVEIVAVNSFRLDLAVLLIFVASVYYIVLDWKLGIAMLGVSIILYIAGRVLPLSVNVALFILGWIFQFVGHSVYEKRQPAFLRNLVHLLVGPLWILKGLVRRG